MSCGVTCFQWNLVTDIRDILSWGFMVQAYEAGTIIALVAGIMGYFVILRRSAFATHALGHTGFSGAAGAILIGANPVYGLLAFTCASGTGIALLGKKASNRDVEIGAVLAFALGLGSLFIALYKGFSSETYSILFGELLAISQSEVGFVSWAGLLILVAFGLFYRPLLFSSLDEDVAEARGVPMLWLNLLFMLMLAVTISMAVQLVGVLLIFALMVTPAAIAVRVTRRPLTAVLVSIGVAVLATWSGLFIAFYTPYPVGFIIVTITFVVYIGIRGGQALSTRFHGRRTGSSIASPSVGKVAEGPG